MKDIFSQKKEPVPRIKYSLMPILDRYILMEFLIPLTVLILGFIILFLIGNIYEELKELLENKATVSVMIEFFLLKLPGNVRFILPISVMLACMYTMASFGKNREIIAIRASGISMRRCCASIYMVAIIITGINFWLNEAVVPTSEKKAEILRKTLGNKRYSNDIFEMLTYRAKDKFSTWFFKYFDVNGIQKEIILKRYKESGVLEWTIDAESAEYVPFRGWVLKNGYMVSFSEQGFLPGPPIEFKEKNLDINLFPETPEDIANQVRPPSELPSIIIYRVLTETKNMAKSSKNVYETTLYSRLAFPLTCIIAVFLGIPIALKNERSGIFISIVSGIIVMLVYQISSNIFCILGERGYLPSLVAGFGPTLVFIVYGILNAGGDN